MLYIQGYTKVTEFCQHQIVLLLLVPFSDVPQPFTSTPTFSRFAPPLLYFISLFLLLFLYLASESFWLLLIYLHDPIICAVWFAELGEVAENVPKELAIAAN